MAPIANPEELSYLGKAAFEQVEKRVASPTINKWASKIFGLQSTLTGESGEALAGYLKKFEASRDAHTNAAYKAVDEYKANPQAFDSKIKTGQYNTRYHQAISGMKGNIEPYLLRGSAQMHARNQMFGPHDELMQGFIHNIATEHGKLRGQAAGDMKAQNVVDALGIYFHDTAYPGSKPGSAESRLATNLSDKHSLVGDIGFMPSEYKAASDTERAAQSVVTSILSYKAGLKHLTTPFNALIGRTLSSAVKASGHLYGTGYDAARAEMLSLNAVGQMLHEERQQQFDFATGKIKNYAPGSFGEFVSKNWMIPGMSAVRQRTATLFAMQGKYAAMELAERLKLPDLKEVEKAQYDLKRLGINPDKVKYNGYVLDNADIRNAMFHNTNDRMHLQPGLNRSTFATGTVTGRLFGQYHAYSSAQANFIQREMMAAVAKGDPMLFIKNMAILGTVFPTVGAGVAGLGAIWSGHNPEGEVEKFKENVGLVEGKRMAGLIQGYADTAGLGIMEGYYRATLRRKLANQMVGAIGNTSFQVAEDSLAAVVGSNKGKGPYQSKSYDPLIRDIIHDVPSAGLLPVIAEILNISPTQQELNKEKPRTPKQERALEKSRDRRALKKLN